MWDDSIIFLKPTQMLHSVLLRQEVFTYLDAGVNGTGPAPLWVAEQDVLWFEVSVEDAFALQDLHGLRNLL